MLLQRGHIGDVCYRGGGEHSGDYRGDMVVMDVTEGTQW